MADIGGFRNNNVVPNRVANTLQGIHQVSGRAFQRISELVSPFTRLGNFAYNDIRNYSDAYNCEAIQHHVVNDFKSAIQSYIEALEISEKLCLKEEIASIHGHLGLAYEDDGQLELAIDSYKAALDFDLQVGVKTIGVANNYSNLGNAYRLLGNDTQVMQYYDESILCHEEALHINQKLEANEGAASNHGNLGQLLEYDGTQSIRSYRCWDRLKS